MTTLDESKLLIILADFSNDLRTLKKRDGKFPDQAAVDRLQALAADEVVAELEGIKRALNNLETAIELGDDARADLVVQQAVAAAWGVMKPQLIAQVDERIALLKQKESQ